MIRRLRALALGLLVVPLMIPALIESRVPLRYWPAAGWWALAHNNGSD